MASDAKAKAAARHRQRLNRLLAVGKQLLRDTDELLLLGKSRTWAEVRGLLQQMRQPYLDYDAVLARARVEVVQFRQTVRRNVAANGPWLAALAEALRGRFGRTHPAMRILGIGKGSRRRPTAATRAAAVTRRQARAARGSRSKKRTP
jgi:hypothetical protein